MGGMENGGPDMEAGVLGHVDGIEMGSSLGPERVLKFEVQMYKLRDGDYLIDFQVGDVQ